MLLENASLTKSRIYPMPTRSKEEPSSRAGSCLHPIMKGRYPQIHRQNFHRRRNPILPTDPGRQRATEPPSQSLRTSQITDSEVFNRSCLYDTAFQRYGSIRPRVGQGSSALPRHSWPQQIIINDMIPSYYKTSNAPGAFLVRTNVYYNDISRILKRAVRK